VTSLSEVTARSKVTTREKRSEVTAGSKVDWSGNGVTSGSKVNGSVTPEFRTVVNVFDDKFQRDSPEVATVYTDRPGVAMDTDSLQSTAAAATDNGPRVYTNRLRRTNALHPMSDKLLSSKGL